MIICKKKRSINIMFLKKNLPKICMFKNVLVLKELHVIMPYPLKKKCYHQIQESSLFHYLIMILKIFKWLQGYKTPNFSVWKIISESTFFRLKLFYSYYPKYCFLPAMQNRALNLLFLWSYVDNLIIQTFGLKFWEQ